MSKIQELNVFNNACDEFVSGKYLLIDIKIASILSIISEDEKLTNIVNTCLQEHSFSTLSKKCFVRNGDEFTFSMPTGEKEIIAFVYNLLYRFKTREIDFYDFLKNYYGAENMGGKEFEEFAHHVITPFKESVNSIYSKRHVLIETSDYQNNYYNKIMTTVRLIVKNMDAYKLNMNQKEEFSMLLNSLYIASEKNDKKLVFSLMIGLDYFTKSNRRVRQQYLMLEECFNTNNQ